MDLLEEIESHPLCGDGAMGTLLIDRGVPGEQCVEELCLSRPELIRVIHQEYIAAGARIIKTNTFGANQVHLARYGLTRHVNEINWQAGQLARQSAKGAFVAGSVGPLSVSPATAISQGIDREECFRTQMGALLDSGVDLIFLETFSDLDELLLALRIKQSLHHCPAICSLAPSAAGQLPNGTSLPDAFARLTTAEADIVGITCVEPEATLRLVEGLPDRESIIAAFPNARHGHYHRRGYPNDISPTSFAEVGALISSRGVRIIGGGYGTTPAHIAALAGAISAERAAQGRL
jgi:methionine synthase / methylenetetrahydrofolate reductase (NADH)